MGKVVYLSPETRAAIDQHGHYINREHAAELLGVSKRTVARLVERGELPAHRVGSARCLRFKTSEVMALIERVA